VSAGHADPQDLVLALALCDRADVITMAAFRRTDLLVETKADRTPVTEADRGVEVAIREQLATARPHDHVVGEEFGGEEFGGEEFGGEEFGGEEFGGEDEAGEPGHPHRRRRWIVDPIDGTKNFVRRIPVWATLLALEVDGVMTVGVVSAPALGRRWWAGRGMGAFAANTGGPAAPIWVSSVADFQHAHVSGNALSSWSHQHGPDPFVALAEKCYWDRNLGDFWSHVLVAEGACDLGLDPIVSLWDLAPLQVIVEEAGGRFTDLTGAATVHGASALSSNGLLHDEALAILQGTGGEER
jgi:histidinol-phosphatase